MGLRSTNKVWKRDEMAALIALFETERCLYDEKDNHFHDEEKQMEAYKRICKIMLRIRPDCTVDEIKYKIKYYRRQYAGELLHRNISIKSGLCTKETYKSSMWCFGLLQFLEDALEENSNIVQEMAGTSDALEESDHEDAEEMIVSKKRKVESSSSEREMHNSSSSSIKKFQSPSSDRKLQNSSSVKKFQSTSSTESRFQNTSSSEKKFQNISSQKKFQSTSSSERKFQNISSERKVHNSSSERELSHSSSSEKDFHNSSSSERELKNAPSERELHNSSSSKKILDAAECILEQNSSTSKKILDAAECILGQNSLDRENVFGQYVASELRALRSNPLLYLQTKQSILENLTSANFELINPE